MAPTSLWPQHHYGPNIIMALHCFGLSRMVNSLFTSLPFKTPHTKAVTNDRLAINIIVKVVTSLTLYAAIAVL